jgi:hypothetical protein
VSITYPPISATIKGEFVIAGTCSDDKGVTASIVTLTDTSDTSKVYGPYAATIDTLKNTWSIKMNAYNATNTAYNGYPIPDGIYEVSIVVNDASGQSSGKASRSITIDNTAPVLVLTKPTSVGNNIPKTYGRTVKIEGSFAEASDQTINKLIVCCYNSITGEKVLTSEFSNISDMSDANPLVIARYYDTTPTDKTSDDYKWWTNYKTLYGIPSDDSTGDDRNKGSDATFFFTVTASDKALRYNDPAQTNGTGSGNVTETFYRGTTDMLKLIRGSLTDFTGFGVLSLEKYLNGTDTTYTNNSTFKGYLEDAASRNVTVMGMGDSKIVTFPDSITVTDSASIKTMLNFCINSKNNPKYTVSGMGISSTTGTDTYDANGYYIYYVGSTINVSIKPGLDNNNIDTHTVTIYYNKVGDTAKHVLWTWNKSVALALAKSALGTSDDTAAEAALASDPKTYRYTTTTDTENTDSLSATTSLSLLEAPQGFEYEFSASGADIDGQELVKSEINGFGFCSKSNMSVPQITIGTNTSCVNLANLAIIKEESFTGGSLAYSGTVSSGEALTAFTYTVTVADSDGKTVGSSFNGNATVAGTDSPYSWGFAETVPSEIKTALSTTDGLYTITTEIKASNTGGTGTLTRTIYLDNKAPEISNVNVATSILKDSTYYIINTNTLSMSGTTSDNFKSGKTELVITGVDSNKDPVSYVSSSSATTWSFADIDLNTFATKDGTDAVATLTATDAAGNSFEHQIQIEFDATPPAWYNDAEKYFTVKNTACTIDSYYKETTLPFCDYYQETGCGLSAVYYQVNGTIPISKSNYTILSGVNNCSITSTATTGIYKVSATMENLLEGSNTIRFIAVDALGNVSSVKEQTVSIDQDQPDFAVNWYSFDGVAYNEAGGTILENGSYDMTLYGTISDAKSGVSGLSFTVGGIPAAATVTYTTSTDLAKITNATAAEYKEYSLANKNEITGWKAVIDKSAIKNGGVVKATSKDIAGNGEAQQIFTLSIDNTSPEVSMSSAYASKLIACARIVDGSATSPSASGTLKSINGAATFGGTATDNYSLSTIKLYTSITDSTATVTAADTFVGTLSGANAYIWTFTKDVTSGSKMLDSTGGLTKFYNGSSESAYIKVVATDTAGNTSVYVYQYTVDPNADRPSIKISNIESTAATLMYDDNAAITGVVSDDDSTDSSVVSSFVGATEKITSGTTNIASGTGTGAAVDLEVIKNNAVKTLSLIVADGYTYSKYKHTVTVNSSAVEAYDITIINPTSGEFTFIPYDITDGVKTVYFFIKDNNSSQFYTANTDDAPLYRPYVQFKSNAAYDNETPISYVSDSEAPSISSVKISYGSDNSVNTHTDKSVDSTLILGGSLYRYAKFTVVATDASGIKSVAVVLTDGTTQKSFSTENYSSSYTTGVFDMSLFKTGTVTVTATVYDKSGLNSNNTNTFMVDNSGPAISMISPLTSDEVTGTVKASGVTTEVGAAGVTYLGWIIPTTAQQGLADADVYALTTWQNTMPSTKTASVWEFDFDGSNSTTNPSLENCCSSIYCSTISNGVYTIPIYFKGTDANGNYTILRSYIKFNKDRDKPTAAVTYPAKTDYDSGMEYVTLGGTVRVSGTATDNVSVSAVYYQIDWDGDGTFDDYNRTGKSTSLDSSYATSSTYYAVVSAADAGIASGWTDGSGTSEADAWWGIKATNAASWSATLNAHKELNATDSLYYSHTYVACSSAATADGKTRYYTSESDSIGTVLASGTSLNSYYTRTALRKISIRACAVDNNNKVGGWSDVINIMIDDNAPEIGQAALYQYSSFNSSAPVTNIMASKTYTADMYLTGQWYLCVTVVDESGISSYAVYKGSEIMESGVTAVAMTNGYTLYIQLSTTDGSSTYSVEAADGSSSRSASSAKYTLKNDNTAPTIRTLLGNGTAITSSTPVQNSQYRYTLSGDVVDASSGFESMAFYFLRSSSTNGNRVYDPEIAYEGSYDTTANYETSTALTHSRTNTTDTNITSQVAANSISFYGYNGSAGSATTGTYTPSAASTVTGNSHIRKGGLIYIGGSYRRIDTIDTSTGEISFTPVMATSLSSVTPFFPYAQVVDNTAAENTSWSGGVYTITGDDGDGMPETITKASTTWTWDGTIYSDYMPDGPITIVCIAFDAAGNIAASSVTTSIQNNAPRLAKMYLGTDLNGDGSYSANELELYNMYDNEGGYQRSASITTASEKYSPSLTPFAIKNGMAVVPEFTGGNGNIQMLFQRDAKINSGTQTTESTDIVGLIPSTTGVIVDSTDITNNYKSAMNTYGAYVLTNAQISGKTGTISNSNNNDGINKCMSFTFWDSTEETTVGTNSNSCLFTVTDFTEDLYDDTPPAGYIAPFYWNSASDNSLYGNRRDNGHIELEKDLPALFTSGGSGLLDREPKVSGKIRIIGYAYDNTRLSTISVSIAGIDFGDGTGTAHVMSAYSSGAWSKNTSTIDGTYGYTFTASDVEIGQTGHAAQWELDIDTSKISGVADVDKLIFVTTTDAAGNTASATAASYATTMQTANKIVYATANEAKLYHFYGTALNANTADASYLVDTAYQTGLPSSTLFTKGSADSTYTSVYAYTYASTPYYRVDVVPYISEVKTALSALSKNYPTSYSRTALGHYPVNSTLSAYYFGFNLTGGAALYYDNLGDAAADTSTGVTVTADSSTYSGYTCYSAPMTSITSNNIVIQVHGVKSLNNINNNNASGSYTGTTEAATGDYTVYSNYYDRQPNNNNNNLLTDDVYMDVWYFNPKAAYPITGRIAQPIMDINPKTGLVGFAFTDGPLYFSMGGTVAGNEYSYNYWQAGYDFFTSTGFAYDSNGFSYGCAAGGDINSDSADDFSFFTSRWGRAARCQPGSYEQWNSRRIEQVGQKLGGVNNFNKTRIQSASFATAYHGTSGTNVYLAYYDDMNSEIRLRFGTITSDNTSTAETLGNGYDPQYNYSTSKYYTTGRSGNATNFATMFTDQYGSYSTSGTQSPQAYNITYSSLLAGRTAGSDTTFNAGEYVSLAVKADETSTTLTGDTLVAVWYDAVNQQLLYSYCLAAPTKIAANQFNRNGWSAPVAVFGTDTTGVGQYCKVVVDKNGGVHIAAYDQLNADVVYAYSSTTDVTAASQFSTCVVDSNGIVGSELTLDVAYTSASGYAVPYIGYYANFCIRPKLAYKVTNANAAAGATNDFFTSKWEITVLPTASTVPEDHINVGVWKSSGVIAKSNSFTNKTLSTGDTYNVTNSGYSSTNYGEIHGNGTSNPILGYQTKSGTTGYIETAQKQ